MKRFYTQILGLRLTMELYDLPGVATMGGSAMLWFTDSEGNMLQVVQM